MNAIEDAEKIVKLISRVRAIADAVEYLGEQGIELTPGLVSTSLYQALNHKAPEILAPDMFRGILDEQ